MTKPAFIFMLIFCCLQVAAQDNYIALKKGKKSVLHFWKDSHITFRLRDGQWLAGTITKITPDSFYFTREVIRYSLAGTDTFHFSGFAFSLKDVYELPTKKQLIVYDGDQVRVIPGHEKFMWIRNGFIFQVAGGGYAGLNVANHLIRGDPPFVKENVTRLGIGAVIFLFGTFLHLRFHPYWRMGKKYHLESF